jgi:uncharacterized protein YjbI with pentapeptide repeats
MSAIPNRLLRAAGGLVALLAISSSARADIFQWEYINPADPDQGKRQSTTLAPDGAGVDVVPGAVLSGRNLTMAYLIGADLTNASAVRTNLTKSDVSRADLTNAYFAVATLTGADFRHSNLTATTFYEANLTGANVRETHAANSTFSAATLTDADFTGAEVRGANFEIVWVVGSIGTGITPAQLYSTASYQALDLRGIVLRHNQLSGVNFASQNLTNVNFGAAVLTGANFRDADVRGANFSRELATSLLIPFGTGITLDQLYSTASYQAKDLSGVSFGSNNLSSSNFVGQNLTNASFYGASLTGADFTTADTRGAQYLDLSGVTTTANLVHPDGHVAGLNLAVGEKLVAYAGVPIPVKVTGEFSIATGATFDITDNAAIADYSGASPVATVRDKVLSGRGGSGLGKGWNGTGITSSAAATANTTEPESRSVGYAENSTMPLGPLTSFRGQPVDGTSILIAYTRTGDVNLDGVVNDDDVTIVGATYAPGVSQPSWALGDFDYNGFVDDDDVTLLGTFYDPAAAPLVGAPAELGNSGATAAVAAVPEPASLLLAFVAVAVGGLFVLPRRA